MLDAFGRTGGEPEFIQSRHEGMAAFMACAHAKLYHQPVGALVGQRKRISHGAGYQQEMDPSRLFADVPEFVQVVMHPRAPGGRMMVTAAGSGL